MGTSNLSSGPDATLVSCCYRLTPQGRACVELVETKEQTIGSLSRYLHDVLMMCGSGVWFEQLRQFMPPRSLEESLHSLLLLGLVEKIPMQETPRRPPAPVMNIRTVSGFGVMAHV